MKLKHLLIGMIAVVALGATGLVLNADDKKDKCPVSGGDAKADIFLNVNGKKVHFCCNNCPMKYKNETLNLDEKSVAEVGKCPISGNAGKKEHLVIHKTAKKVAFCCNNCPKGFAKKNGFEFAAEPADPGKCPLSGNPAKKDQKIVVNGKPVYFCCGNCPKAYAKKVLGVDPGEKADKCPLSGNPTKPETELVFVQSKAVYFCCGNCPKAYISKNFKKGAGSEKKEKKTKKKEL